MQRIAVPSTIPPPAGTDMPLSFDSILTTSPTLKCPPIKKSCRSNAIIKGQVITKFFSLESPHSYTELPDGCSLFILGYWKPFPHENVKTQYIILDAFRCKWTAPQVFNVWCEQIERKALEEDKLKTHQITLVCSGNNFFLAHSNRKTKYTQVIHSIIPTTEDSKDEAFPNADSEDEQEKKISNFFQNKFLIC